MSIFWSVGVKKGICTNAIGSFACSCTVGYLLDGNEFNCTGKFAPVISLFPAFLECCLPCARIRNGHEESSCWRYFAFHYIIPFIQLDWYIPSCENFVLQFTIFCYFLQTLMSVIVMTWTTVMRMHSVLTQREVSPAPATLVTLEMESTVQVSSIAAFLRMKRTNQSNGCTFVYSHYCLQ